MIHPLFDITGRRAIVTGGSRGLGRGMAEGLMEAGCEVVIIGTSDSVLGVAEEYRGKGFACHAVKADLSDKAECARAYRESLEALGGELDILVVAHGIQRRHPANEFPDDDWEAVIDTNLNSVFWLARASANTMLPRGYGKIILTASMCSFFGGKTIPAYSAAKGGVAQLTKAFSNDLFAKGINVNAIAPGYMDTAMNEALHDASSPRYMPDRDREITARIPAHRWGTPDDMKGTCVFLASHASDYLGGAIIPVDGGYLVV